MADDPPTTPQDVDPLAFLSALLRLSPQEAEAVRAASPPPRQDKPQAGPYRDYGDR